MDTRSTGHLEKKSTAEQTIVKLLLNVRQFIFVASVYMSIKLYSVIRCIKLYSEMSINLLNLIYFEIIQRFKHNLQRLCTNTYGICSCKKIYV